MNTADLSTAVDPVAEEAPEFGELVLLREDGGMAVDVSKREEDELNPDEYVVPRVPLPPIATLPGASVPSDTMDVDQPIPVSPGPPPAWTPPRPRRRRSTLFLPGSSDSGSIRARNPSVELDEGAASPAPSLSARQERRAEKSKEVTVPALSDSEEEEIVLRAPRVHRPRSSARLPQSNPAPRAMLPPESQEDWWEAALNAAQGADVSVLYSMASAGLRSSSRFGAPVCTFWLGPLRGSRPGTSVLDLQPSEGVLSTLR